MNEIVISFIKQNIMPSVSLIRIIALLKQPSLYFCVIFIFLQETIQKNLIEKKY